MNVGLDAINTMKRPKKEVFSWEYSMILSTKKTTKMKKE